jgi:hypothetical protein
MVVSERGVAMLTDANRAWRLLWERREPRQNIG